jgi:DNA polymerase-3 subunit beta
MTATEAQPKTAAQFTVQRDDLIRELAVVAKASSHSKAIPVLSTVLLCADGNPIKLAASDLEISIQSSIEGAIEDEGGVCLPAKRLLDYVRALPAGQVHFKTGANHWVSITAARSKSRIAGMSADNFPALPEAPGEPTITLSADNWATMIKRAAYAISQEESRFTLRGGLLIQQGEHAAIVTTDGHRLCMARSEQAVGAFTKTIIPAGLLNHMGDLSGDIGLAITDAGLFLSAGERTMSTRRNTSRNW